MANVERFEDLEAWKQTRQLVAAVYDLTRRQEIARDFGLVDQLRRASVSIMSNVAEGFERRHLQEKLQFHNVARGSAGEVRSLLYVIEDNFPNLLSSAIALRSDVVVIGALITGLIRSTESRKNRGPFTSLLSLFM